CFSSLFSRPPRAPLFPYTTLFRSDVAELGRGDGALAHARHHGLVGRARTERRGRDQRKRAGGPRASLHAHHRISRENGKEEGKLDRKSTRLNSSHDQISYAVFCLK